MEREYAQALSSSLARGTDEAKLVSGLVSHLKEEGRMKLLPGIVRELKRLQTETAKLAPSLEIANEEDRVSAIAGAKEAGITAGEVTVNPSLIRGWRARSGSVLVDRSAKQALVDLYQKITN